MTPTPAPSFSESGDVQSPKSGDLSSRNGTPARRRNTPAAQHTFLLKIAQAGWSDAQLPGSFGDSVGDHPQPCFLAFGAFKAGFETAQTDPPELSTSVEHSKESTNQPTRSPAYSQVGDDRRSRGPSPGAATSQLGRAPDQHGRGATVITSAASPGRHRRWRSALAGRRGTDPLPAGHVHAVTQHLSAHTQLPWCACSCAPATG